MKSDSRLVLRTSLPLILAQLAFALNGFVTTYFLSRHSSTALHASLPGSLLAIAIFSFFNLMLGYAGTVFAQSDGGGNRKSALYAFIQSFWLALLACPLLFLGIPLARFILSFFAVTPEVLASEMRYFVILLPNSALTILATILGGYFTGRGETKFVGGVTILGFFINMIGSAIFIPRATGGGLFGAALAQTLGHLVPCLILAVAIIRRHEFARLGVSIRPNLRAHETLEVLRLGFPNGIRVFFEIGVYFAFTAFIAELDSSEVGVSTFLLAVNGVVYSMVQGLGAGVEILVGRAYGARNRAQIISISRFAFILTLLACGIYALTLIVGQQPLTRLATRSAPDTARAVAVVAPLLLILMVKAPVETLSQLLQSILRGLGRTPAVLFSTTISALVVWLPAYLAVKCLCPTMANYWWTMLLSCVVSFLLLGFSLWRALRVVEKTMPKEGLNMV